MNSGKISNIIEKQKHKLMAGNCKNVFANSSHSLLKRRKQNVKKEYQNLTT